MKFIMMISLLLSFTSVSASDKSLTKGCKDSNFNGLKIGESYNKLKYHNRFNQLLSEDSPTPAGFSDYFGAVENMCFSTTATYLKHVKSNKTYVMFTTYDDYCDGGNTSGIIVDMEIYKTRKLKESVVAVIGDSEVICFK